MSCEGSAVASELEYVQSLAGRESDQCRGPIVALSFAAFRLEQLEESFRSHEAHELLWGGFQPYAEQSADATFELCVAHWVDLATLAGVRAREYRRADWFETASVLLDQALRTARMDPKEVANLMTWQRSLLT